MTSCLLQKTFQMREYCSYLISSQIVFVEPSSKLDDLALKHGFDKSSIHVLLPRWAYEAILPPPSLLHLSPHLCICTLRFIWINYPLWNSKCFYLWSKPTSNIAPKVCTKSIKREKCWPSSFLNSPHIANSWCLGWWTHTYMLPSTSSLVLAMTDSCWIGWSNTPSQLRQSSRV